MMCLSRAKLFPHIKIDLYTRIPMHINVPSQNTWVSTGKPPAPLDTRIWFSLGFKMFNSFVCVLLFAFVSEPSEVAPRSSYEMSYGMPYESFLGTPWGPRYGYLCKACIFAEIVRGYNYSWKERWTLYRMGCSTHQKDERWFALWTYCDIMIL